MTRRISELYRDITPIERRGDTFLIPGERFPAALPGAAVRLHILALGDVGGTILTGLRLLGGDVIREIGIYDLNEKVLARYEMEANQIAAPQGSIGRMPPVYIADEPLDCDLALFCATAGVPPVSEEGEAVDVRMVQFETNRRIVDLYGKMAVETGYQGGFFVVSDPVDPLCQAARNLGFRAEQLRGFGLGVMYGRALYHAKDPDFFRAHGRVFGPHGEDLAVAWGTGPQGESDGKNGGQEAYQESYSLTLTSRTTSANQKMRGLGFKPYIAPALSSGALSVLALLRGEWQYSSLCFGDVFLGVRNRLTEEGRLVEDLPLDEALFARVEEAYDHLRTYQ